MADHEVKIDRSKTLEEQPETGHNRWHPDIPPIVRCASGDEVTLETRDALDGQLPYGATVKDMESLDVRVAHALTGPVYIDEAEPGDLLEVEIVDVLPTATGFTVQIPGLGFLRDLYTEPYIVSWCLQDGFATAEALPGVRVPGAPFMGTMGVAPSYDILTRARAREAAASNANEAVPPEPMRAVPAGGRIAEEGLRTIPPRENGGNVDIKQLIAGARLFLPVHVRGALFSAGDGHFAQGDGESCGAAIEMAATLRARLTIHQGAAKEKNLQSPHFEFHESPYRPGSTDERHFLATSGIPITEAGENRAADLNLAARNALAAMIELLQERGFDRQQAYAICSVAVDIRVSQLVNLPNVVVSAFLPTDIFV